MSAPEVQITQALADRVVTFMRLPASYAPQALVHAQVIGQQAAEYTRGHGFTVDGFPSPSAASVIITATARMLANPDQSRRDVGNVSIRSSFEGWNTLEKKLLDTLRRNAR